NVFSIYLHSQDYDRFSSWQDTLLDELQRVLMEHAEKQRYMFVGGVSVTLERDDEVRAGRFETESRTERGSVAPATGAAQAGPGGDADIILEDTGVSRHHLELRTEPDATLVATDLGSTNGTFVDGERIRTPVALQDRSLLKIGRTRLTVLLPTAGPATW